MTKITINVSRPLKYDPKLNVIRMTNIPIKVSRPLKYNSKKNVVKIKKKENDYNLKIGH
jgi:hypothetical protein